jgi:hypothetical protein
MSVGTTVGSTLSSFSETISFMLIIFTLQLITTIRVLWFCHRAELLAILRFASTVGIYPLKRGRHEDACPRVVVFTILYSVKHAVDELCVIDCDKYSTSKNGLSGTSKQGGAAEIND